MPDSDSPDSQRIPQAVWEGTLSCFGIDIAVAVLDTGQRIFVGDGMQRLLEAMAAMNELRGDAQAEVESLVKFIKGAGVPQ